MRKLSFETNKFMKLAFTLAEVLIVLGIIGVVAEMTIPTLMNNVQSSQYKSGAKKAYSAASQAITMMQANGDDDFASYAASTHTFKPVFMTYFRVIQDCNWADCFPAGGYKTIDGVTASTGLLDDGQFITADGMLWMIENYSVQGTLLISADVNGSKKPNVLGKDVFTFEVQNSALIPEGTASSLLPASSYCNKSTSNVFNGMGCMVNIMQGVDY